MACCRRGIPAPHAQPVSQVLELSHKPTTVPPFRAKVMRCVFAVDPDKSMPPGELWALCRGSAVIPMVTEVPSTLVPKKALSAPVPAKR